MFSLTHPLKEDVDFAYNVFGLAKPWRYDANPATWMSQSVPEKNCRYYEALSALATPSGRHKLMLQEELDEFNLIFCWLEAERLPTKIYNAYIRIAHAFQLLQLFQTLKKVI
jgi:hypothetical protein